MILHYSFPTFLRILSFLQGYEAFTNANKNLSLVGNNLFFKLKQLDMYMKCVNNSMLQLCPKNDNPKNVKPEKHFLTTVFFSDL